MAIYYLHLFIFLHIIVSATGSDFMACYCNLPECMDDSYSCKSRAGCFQELPHYNMPQPPYASRQRAHQDSGTAETAMELRYGCLELWPTDAAPFQCTEPGIRKAPVNGHRQSPDYELHDIEQQAGRIIRGKNSDRRRNHHKLFESRRWNSYYVPLRCCIGDMCNRRRNSGSNLPITTTTMESTSSTSDTDVVIASHHYWWFTSTMIFVPVIGGITFLLLMAVGCWILHFDGERPCGNRRKCKGMVENGAQYPSPTYYFCETAKLTAASNGKEEHSVTSCKCIVLAAATTTEAEFSNQNCTRCVHVPIFLTGDYVVNVKTASTTRTLR